MLKGGMSSFISTLKTIEKILQIHHTCASANERPSIIRVIRRLVYRRRRGIGSSDKLPTVLYSFFASSAEFYLASPFGAEHLRGGDTPSWVGVEDGVDDVSAASL